MQAGGHAVHLIPVSASALLGLLLLFILSA
jgi:hypothetical protein